MKKTSIPQMIGSTLAIFCLALAVGRCSPLSSSINKEQIGTLNSHDAQPILPGIEIPGVLATDSKSFDLAVAKLPGLTHLLEFDATQVAAFKSSGAFSFKLDAQAITKDIKVIYLMPISHDSPSPEDLKDFALLLTPKAENSWALALDPNVDPALSKAVRKNVLKLMLIYTAKDETPAVDGE